MASQCCCCAQEERVTCLCCRDGDWCPWSREDFGQMWGNFQMLGYKRIHPRGFPERTETSLAFPSSGGA